MSQESQTYKAQILLRTARKGIESLIERCREAADEMRAELYGQDIEDYDNPVLQLDNAADSAQGALKSLLDVEHYLWLAKSREELWIGKK